MAITFFNNFTFIRKIEQLNAKLVFKTHKCPVYFHVFWIETTLTRFKKQHCSQTLLLRLFSRLNSSCQQPRRTCYFPITCSNVIYQFVCRCNSWYVSRTIQRLQNELNNIFPTSRLSKLQKSFLFLQS